MNECVPLPTPAMRAPAGVQDAHVTAASPRRAPRIRPAVATPDLACTVGAAAPRAARVPRGPAAHGQADISTPLAHTMQDAIATKKQCAV